jgi:hypothetical protein
MLRRIISCRTLARSAGGAVPARNVGRKSGPRRCAFATEGEATEGDAADEERRARSDGCRFSLKQASMKFSASDLGAAVHELSGWRYGKLPRTGANLGAFAAL